MRFITCLLAAAYAYLSILAGCSSHADINDRIREQKRLNAITGFAVEWSLIVEPITAPQAKLLLDADRDGVVTTQEAQDGLAFLSRYARMKMGADEARQHTD